MSLTAGLRRIVSFPAMLGALLVAGSYSFAKMNILDPDTLWHIAVGQRILSTHAWPWTDPYSSTAFGTAWIAYEWLGEVVMAAAASFAGLWSATILLTCLSAVLILLIYYYATLKCGNSKAAFVACITLVPVIGPFLTLRPQLIGAIFLVITLIVLEKFRCGQVRALWILPPLFLCWVNTHGSFVFGFFTLGMVWLCGQAQFSSGGLVAERWTKRQSLQLLLTMLFCTLILPITPYGTRVAAYPLSMAFSQPVNVKNIQEWQALGPDLLLGKLFLGVALLFFLACLVQQPKFRLPEIALALVGAYAACVHLRFILLFVIFLAPLWASLLSRWVPAYRVEADHPVLNAVLIAAIALILVHFFPTRNDTAQQAQEKYPAGALQYLAQHPVHGQFLNEYGWGGYLIWTGSPRNMIFVDGRVDIYEFTGVLSDYLTMMRLDPGAFQLLKKYDVQACLIKQDAPLATALQAMPGWERVYRDDLTALYIRKPSAPSSELPNASNGAPKSPRLP